MIEASPTNLVSGLSGLLLALLSPPPEPSSRNLARTCGEFLLGHLDAKRDLKLYPPDGALMRCLPDPKTSVAYALFQLGRLDDHELILRHLTPESFKKAEPTPGNLLVRLRTAMWAEDQAVFSEVGRFLQKLDRTSPSLDLLDGLELALAARQVRNTPYDHQATAIASELIERRQDSGSWFPDQLGADHHRLSAIHGIGGIALALMRLQFPDATRSVRLLDPQC